MLFRIKYLTTLKAVMSLKNKVVPFRFLSEPMGGANIAYFAMSAASENRRHAKRQHVCATRRNPDEVAASLPGVTTFRGFCPAD
jgi:hypothetical protein